MLLPTLEEQQRENKSWQDVFDIPQKRKAETSGLLDDLRAACPGPAARVENAGKLKEEANQSFAAGDYELALRSYLGALWLLRLDDPPLPKLLIDPVAPIGPGLLQMLGEPGTGTDTGTGTGGRSEGSPKPDDDTSTGVEATAGGATEARIGAGLGAEGEGDPGGSVGAPPGGEADAARGGEETSSPHACEVGDATIRATRMTLQLNVAAAALKLSDWPSALRACEHVLAGEVSHPKALYRLAQAHEGAGDLGAAMAVLHGELLQHDPNHREGKRLLAALKARRADERKTFGGLFDRAQRARDPTLAMKQQGETMKQQDEAMKQQDETMKQEDETSTRRGRSEEGLYSDAALELEAQRRKDDKEKLLTLPNLAKLPPDMWPDTFKDLDPKQMQKLAAMPDGAKELCQQMPDGGWAKALANMSPEDLKAAKEAVDLYKAREKLKEEGLLPPEDDAGEEGAEDEDAMEAALDKWLTRISLGVLAVAVLTALTFSIVGWPGGVAEQGVAATVSS